MNPVSDHLFIQVMQMLECPDMYEEYRSYVFCMVEKACKPKVVVDASNSDNTSVILTNILNSLSTDPLDDTRVSFLNIFIHPHF